MIEVHTERIWHLHNQDLVTRANEGISIDADEGISEEVDIHRPLTVECGLIRNDVIVFLGFIGLRGLPKNKVEVGYLVSGVDSDGSGVIVPGDLVAREPRTYLNEQIVTDWQNLHALGYTLEDFTLPKTLDEYIARSVIRRP